MTQEDARTVRIIDNEMECDGAQCGSGAMQSDREFQITIRQFQSGKPTLGKLKEGTVRYH